jgi:RNA polymerase sigma factor (sigma-70 family)
MEEGPLNGPAEEARARQLFEAYHGRLVGFFKKQGVPSEDALDLTHEALWRVFQHMGKLRASGSMDSFVMRVAANLWKNDLRYRGAEKRRHGELSLDQLLEDREVRVEAGSLGWGPEPSDPLQDTLAAERLAGLRDCFERLASRRKSCLDLHVFQGRPYQEIATILRISVESVKSHIFQARRQLADCLRKKEEGEA